MSCLELQARALRTLGIISAVFRPIFQSPISKKSSPPTPQQDTPPLGFVWELAPLFVDMPNADQIAFVLSSLIAFAACTLAFQHFFPGILPAFSIDLLLGRPPNPQKTLTVYDQLLLKMGLQDLFTYNGPSDLLRGDKLMAAAATALTAYIVISWLTGSSESLEHSLVVRRTDRKNVAREEASPRSQGVQGVPTRREDRHLTE